MLQKILIVFVLFFLCLECGIAATVAADDNVVAEAKADGGSSLTGNNGNENNENGRNKAKEPTERMTFWGFLRAGGIVGYIIIILSFFAVAIVIEFLFTVRRNLVMPKNLADSVMQQLTQGQLGTAIQVCNENSSLLARVLLAGMKGFEFGWDAVEKGTEDALEEEASKLYRKIEYLNVIGNITPMLGLLGTVIGMIIAFQQLVESGGSATPAELAKGIYLALITTVQGLVVALPALGLHSILAGRIAMLVSEATTTAEQILNPIKRSFLKKK
ncbi:MAG: MotA/TolQ/ExbB proton channel family protein [Planctomycetaceae bacterium]|jgi:biopolymer transport protein ExbB|nr:MotA/TolQ/ExbB proton channel family protein [Planctomycetaceae bacterium]